MIYAGILAGGTGSRMGITDMPKQFLDLGGRPILIHTVEKFLLVHEIQKIVLGIHPDWVTYTEDLVDKYLSSYKDRILVVEGGSDRNSTIENIITAIDELQPLTEEDIIVTHDSVRPFVSLKTIQLYPEITAGTVIAWRRNIPYAQAVLKFIDKINAFQA